MARSAERKKKVPVTSLSTMVPMITADSNGPIFGNSSETLDASASAMPATAFEELITKVKELDMDDVRAAIATREDAAHA